MKITIIGTIASRYELSRGGLNLYEDLSNTIDLYKKINKIQLDIFLSYFIKSVIYGTLAAKMAKVPRKIAMIEGLDYAFTVQPKDYCKKAMQQSLNFTDEKISPISIRVSKALKKSFWYWSKKYAEVK